MNRRRPHTTEGQTPDRGAARVRVSGFSPSFMGRPGRALSNRAGHHKRRRVVVVRRGNHDGRRAVGDDAPLEGPEELGDDVAVRRVEGFVAVVSQRGAGGARLRFDGRVVLQRCDGVGEDLDVVEA